MPQTTAWMRRARAALERPHDIVPLVVVRVLIGLILAWEMVRHFQGNRLWYDYVLPLHHFTYFPWEFVKPWPEPWIHAHVAVVGLCGLALAAGFLYRLTAPLACVGFGLIFLWDQAQYLNHHYALWLVLFVFALLPAHRALSLDTRLGLAPSREEVPAWCVYAARVPVACVFVYGGVAKLNPDWLAGWPLREWVVGRTLDTPLEPWFAPAWVPLVMSWGGMLYDLAVVPLLSWRRTRLLGIVWSLAFHGLNKLLFSIGVFPVMSLVLTLLFLPAAWHRRWLQWDPPTAPPAGHVAAVRSPVAVLLILFVAWQLLFPLRHWLYPGNVNWTEEGHKYSWRMKLRDKTGDIEFRIVDRRTGEARTVDLRLWLTDRQIRDMADRPRLILQTAHLLRDEGPFGPAHTAVFVPYSCVSLNLRPCQPMVDPTVDLAREAATWRPFDWLLPLDPTLQPGSDLRPPSW